MKHKRDDTIYESIDKVFEWIKTDKNFTDDAREEAKEFADNIFNACGSNFLQESIFIIVIKTIKMMQTQDIIIEKLAQLLEGGKENA
jgi:hypothetical protein